MMKLYFVYILECSNGAYYTGLTNNLERRMREHQDGINLTCFTYNKRPLKLVFQQCFNDVNQAIIFEKQIKGWRREKKEALITGNWNLLPQLAKRQF